ncbi:MAG: RHS repeat-associated core domain-containing protein [Cellulosilyticaceae bacterium]
MGAEIEENNGLTKFIFHQDTILAELDTEDNTKARLIRGHGIVAANISGIDNSYYYHQDEQGSTAIITDENAHIKNSYHYDAFGKILESQETLPNRITYTGQQYDPLTQQYYLRARYYNPIIGRFTQEDTYRSDGLNLYAYCSNNPVSYYDPSGYAKEASPPCKAPALTDADGGDTKREGKAETYYRAMSQEHYDVLVETEKLSATTETCISPTKAYSEQYEGVLVEFKVKVGTTQALEEIGVRNGSSISAEIYPNMPKVSKGWNQNKAFFKGEGISGNMSIGEPQINIGLGKGKALDIFNDNIINFERK